MAFSTILIYAYVAHKHGPLKDVFSDEAFKTLPGF